MPHPADPRTSSEAPPRRSRYLLGIAVLLFASMAASTRAADDRSPCQDSLDFLKASYYADKATQKAFHLTFEQLKPLPKGYYYNHSRENPWKTGNSGGEDLMKAVVEFYEQVCTLLPQIIGTNDNALDSIQYFAWLYYHNEPGRLMVEGIDPADTSKPLPTVQEFLIRFNKEYKTYMDSSASQSVVQEWVDDPRLEIDDYILTEASEYPSWNAFFARDIKISTRPVTMPDRDYVVVSPTDCIMNPLVQVLQSETGEIRHRLLENPLQHDTVLDVKGIPISVSSLLANAPEELKKKFVGGSGLSCVLMPNTYHHFHSPVDGIIRYAEIVEAGVGSEDAWGTFGYSDWPNWVPLDGNVGRPGTDFSQFEGFQRGVIVIEVTYDNLPKREPKRLKGLVASIPVGLDTVGSVVFAEGVEPGARVVKGVTGLGNFFFGGSLNILLFSPIDCEGHDPRDCHDVQMLTPAVQTRMGNQIGILNTPYPAPSTPWTPDSGRSRDRKVLRHLHE